MTVFEKTGANLVQHNVLLLFESGQRAVVENI